jgi:hypothetical protein
VSLEAERRVACMVLGGGDLKERDHLEDVVTDGKIILKGIKRNVLGERGMD